MRPSKAQAARGGAAPCQSPMNSVRGIGAPWQGARATSRLPLCVAFGRQGIVADTLRDTRGYYGGTQGVLQGVLRGYSRVLGRPRVQLCTHLLTGAPRPQSAAVAALKAAYAAALAVLQVPPMRRLALAGVLRE